MGRQLKAIGFDSKSLNRLLGIIESCRLLSKTFITAFIMSFGTQLLKYFVFLMIKS